MPRPITKKLKSTTVTAVRLDVDGMPVEEVVSFARVFRSDDAAGKAARKELGEIIVKSVEVSEDTYTMELSAFLMHAVKVAEGDTGEGGNTAEAEAVAGN